MAETGKHIVLFGGSFDPPHVGHLTMGQLALEQTGADAVWFLPAPQPPHKQLATPSLGVRKAMVERLIEGFERFALCLIEEELPPPSYTVDTIAAVKARWPHHRFEFLIGADSLAQLPSWHEAERLTETIPFLVAGRSGFPYDVTLQQTKQRLSALQARQLSMPLLDVSSTWLRDRLEAGLPTCGLCPPEVAELWIEQNES